jgi:hypothetical protein
MKLAPEYLNGDDEVTDDAKAALDAALTDINLLISDKDGAHAALVMPNGAVHVFLFEDLRIHAQAHGLEGPELRALLRPVEDDHMRVAFLGRGAGVDGAYDVKFEA